MSREIAPFVAVMLLAAASIASAQDSHFRPDRQQIPTPGCLIMTGAWEGGSKSCSQNEHDTWLADIQHWRDERRIRIGYDGSRYDLPALKWTQSSFFQPQMMVEDRYFYDPVAHQYTVDRYLDDVEKRYGGIDAVLIWPTYPNMGIDNRNQHDMIRSMPGGVTGVKQMIADFHRRNVRVLRRCHRERLRHRSSMPVVMSRLRNGACQFLSRVVDRVRSFDRRMPLRVGVGIGMSPVKRWIVGTDTPASRGVQGPGEITIASGRSAAISSRVTASLRRTSRSAPSSPRYWTRL